MALPIEPMQEGSLEKGLTETREVPTDHRPDRAPPAERAPLLGGDTAVLTRPRRPIRRSPRISDPEFFVSQLSVQRAASAAAAHCGTGRRRLHADVSQPFPY
jgi:hypothetical protein